MGSIFGGIQASKAMRNVKNNLNDQKKKNQDWYDRNYHADPTQMAGAQFMITKTEESIKNRNRQAAGSAAVMGGTEESVAATKAANAQAMADAAAQIAVDGERRKDAIEAQYQAKDEAIQNQLNNLEMQKAQAVSQAVGGMAHAGAGIANMF